MFRFSFLSSLPPPVVFPPCFSPRRAVVSIPSWWTFCAPGMPLGYFTLPAGPSLLFPADIPPRLTMYAHRTDLVKLLVVGSMKGLT